MYAAELRSRLTTLGLSANQLADLAHMDLRGIRRQLKAQSPVTPKTVRAVEALEAQAAELRREYLESGDVILPDWSSGGEPLPGSFYHAVAGSVVSDLSSVKYEGEYSPDGLAHH